MSGWLHLTGRMEGELVAVEPLRSDHERGLFDAGHDREMWTYLTAFPNAFETGERFHRWMEEALAATAAGEEGAWAIIRPRERTTDRQHSLSGASARASLVAWAAVVAHGCERGDQADAARPGLRAAGV